MPLVKISTSDGPAQVVAETHDVFAIHNTWQGEIGEFTLTHIPSGFAFLERVSFDDAVAAASELLAGSIDWRSIGGQEDLTDAHKAQGREMRTRYPPIDSDYAVTP